MSVALKKCDYLLKIILIGDVGVGKSSLLGLFVNQKLVDNQVITVGVEFHQKLIQIDDKLIKLQIWDTTGQEAFRSVTRLYYRAAAGAIIVYDITRRQTFNNILDWYQETKNNSDLNQKYLLVGNKSDLINQRQVSYSEGESLARDGGMIFIETSAKNGSNVEQAFYWLTQEILQQFNNVNNEFGKKQIVQQLNNLRIKSQHDIISNQSDKVVKFESNSNLNKQQIDQLKYSQQQIQFQKNDINNDLNAKDYEEYYSKSDDTKLLKYNNTKYNFAQQCQCCQN